MARNASGLRCEWRGTELWLPQLDAPSEVSLEWLAQEVRTMERLLPRATPFLRFGCSSFLYASIIDCMYVENRGHTRLSILGYGLDLIPSYGKWTMSLYVTELRTIPPVFLIDRPYTTLPVVEEAKIPQVLRTYSEGDWEEIDEGVDLG